MTDDTAISYEAALPGTPVLSSSGTEIGRLEHVLEVPELDVFDGLVIATSAGLRFIDADRVQRITRSSIQCSVDDSQASALPPPEGPPVYRVDALADSGHNLHDTLGRIFGRPHWKREHE
ncbi:MAG: hypothetical protein ACLPUO_19130 [Streptosporangiaceae bacterium]|jgi:hypothetical protein